jgi:glucosylceramidase
VVVDPRTRTARYTPEYYLMKHLSRHVQPGARLLQTVSTAGYDNQLAFLNPDRSLVVVMRNDLVEPLQVRVAVGGQIVAPILPPDSYNTLLLANPRAVRPGTNGG